MSDAIAFCGLIYLAAALIFLAIFFFNKRNVSGSHN